MTTQTMTRGEPEVQASKPETDDVTLWSVTSILNALDKPALLYWADVARALRVKPDEAEQQRHNAGATFAACALRLRGGLYRFVLTPEQMATWMREAT